ncbi:DUF192 domain-containing protein [Cognatiyoonia sp. IB215446]|uniref:DUF192 domain-containing protein n=1 Tax=Cognatiyoonia sp. IB215446 TaxID=3097355 RepID=UPI002A0D8AA0|nr:DUF192 domain-containing protein [Cognatiyoonia sp. IB215446]MDX8348752.1 DUF192 domain-containing protein [Cognatiyoonia sp. IB215446]
MKPAVIAIGLISVGQPALAACAEDKVTIFGDWGQANFAVEIADSPQERARGLMFVEDLPTLSGMLFIYEQPQSVSFWMKNTLIPLDMVFAAPDGEILSIHENAIPGDLTPIPGGEGVQMVLEVNGGMTSRLGVSVGDVLQHPSFGPDAIRPCGEKTDS